MIGKRPLTTEGLAAKQAARMPHMCSGGRPALCIRLICHENKCANDNNGQLCFHVLARAEWGQPDPAKSGDGGELT